MGNHVYCSFMIARKMVLAFVVGVILCFSFHPLDVASEIPPQLENTVVNPNFNSTQLSNEMRKWYDRLWKGINNSHDINMSRSSSGDVYTMGRFLNDSMVALLTALRITGDPLLLEEIYQLSENMRAQLKDWSITSFGGTEYEKDGYLNWVYKGSSAQYKGTDVHVMDEFLTHANVASFAYAFYLNQSVDKKYKEAAEFWIDYLINHYEAKWRKRKNVSATGPFLHYGLMHPYIHSIRYHYYMYHMTGTPWYLVEAERKASLVSQHMIFVSTLEGNKGVVWDHRVTKDPKINDKTPLGCQPQHYFGYTMAAAVDLAFENFGPFSRTLIERMGNSLNDNSLGSGTSEYKASEVTMKDICGAVDTAGLKAFGPSRPPYAKGTCGNCTIARMNNRPYSISAAWSLEADSMNKTLEFYSIFQSNTDAPRNIFIPTSMLLRELLTTSPLNSTPNAPNNLRLQ